MIMRSISDYVDMGLDVATADQGSGGPLAAVGAVLLGAGALAALAEVAVFRGTKDQAWKTLGRNQETVNGQMTGLMGVIAATNDRWEETYVPNDDVRRVAEKTEKALLGAAAFVRSLR